MIISALVGFGISIVCATMMGLMLRMNGERSNVLSVARQRRAVMIWTPVMLVASGLAGLSAAGPIGAVCGMLGALPLVLAGVADLVGLRKERGTP